MTSSLLLLCVDLSIPEDEVAAFPQLFAQVGVSCPVLQRPLLGAGGPSRDRGANLGDVHGILPVDQ